MLFVDGMQSSAQSYTVQCGAQRWNNLTLDQARQMVTSLQLEGKQASLIPVTGSGHQMLVE